MNSRLPNPIPQRVSLRRRFHRPAAEHLGARQQVPVLAGLPTVETHEPVGADIGESTDLVTPTLRVAVPDKVQQHDQPAQQPNEPAQQHDQATQQHDQPASPEPFAAAVLSMPEAPEPEIAAPTKATEMRLKEWAYPIAGTLIAALLIYLAAFGLQQQGREFQGTRSAGWNDTTSNTSSSPTASPTGPTGAGSVVLEAVAENSPAATRSEGVGLETVSELSAESERNSEATESTARTAGLQAQRPWAAPAETAASAGNAPPLETEVPLVASADKTARSANTTQMELNLPLTATAESGEPSTPATLSDVIAPAPAEELLEMPFDDENSDYPTTRFSEQLPSPQADQFPDTDFPQSPLVAPRIPATDGEQSGGNQVVPSSGDQTFANQPAANGPPTQRMANAGPASTAQGFGGYQPPPGPQQIPGYGQQIPNPHYRGAQPYAPQPQGAQYGAAPATQSPGSMQAPAYPYGQPAVPSYIQNHFVGQQPPAQPAYQQPPQQNYGPVTPQLGGGQGQPSPEQIRLNGNIEPFPRMQR